MHHFSKWLDMLSSLAGSHKPISAAAMEDWVAAAKAEPEELEELDVEF